MKQIMHAKRPELAPLSVAEAFYLLTLGGAQVLSIDHKVGNFAVGKVPRDTTHAAHAAHAAHRTRGARTLTDHTRNRSWTRSSWPPSAPVRP
jgi:cytosine/adenosine deaminase-related metal-dependent hydrolase